MAADEQYIFKPEAKRKISILFGVGILLFVLGIILAMNSGGHHEGAEHGSIEAAKSLVASTDHAASAAEEGGHHGSPVWLKKIYASLWHNNIFFAGIGIIGLFFVAIQYAAQAGWSTPINRIPLAMGQWIPIAGVLMLIIWFAGKGDLFHWTHHDLYDPQSADYDKVLDQKSVYFFWLGSKGGFPTFYILRMVAFFGLWYWFYMLIKKQMLAEDIEGGTQYWYSARKLSAIFLVIFAVSSSVAAWDWVMSIDPHWFSTMFGWYVFASWWVTGLAAITLIVVYLKDAGYLKMVNANHLHDLGKFVFAFSIFWTYIWFSQFMLIY
ncbi:MAG TPA: quinol:cytochrome C oxidoreductase, partial [Cyclobacteriaceae bacterium]|nr:quinol:cytochrome C oxidoreductase [Cyclobacteriaceae bacterium]